MENKATQNQVNYGLDLLFLEHVQSTYADMNDIILKSN
jgi:hypothetical protein